MTNEELQRIITRLKARQTSYRANNRVSNTDDKAMRVVDSICQKYQRRNQDSGNTNDSSTTAHIDQHYQEQNYQELYRLLMEEISQDVINNDDYKTFRLGSLTYERCQFCQKLQATYDSIINEINKQHAEGIVSKAEFDQYNTQIRQKFETLESNNAQLNTKLAELQSSQGQLQQQVETYEQENLALKRHNEQQQQALTNQKQQLKMMTQSVKKLLSTNPELLKGRHLKIQNLSDNDFESANKWLEEVLREISHEANSNSEQKTRSQQPIKEQKKPQLTSTTNDNAAIKKQHKQLTEKILPKSAHDALWTLSAEHRKYTNGASKDSCIVADNNNGFFQTNSISSQLQAAMSNIIKLAAIDERDDKAAIHQATINYLKSLINSGHCQNKLKQKLQTIVDNDENLKKSKFIDNSFERVREIVDHFTNNDPANTYLPINQQTISELEQQLNEANNSSNQPTG